MHRGEASLIERLEIRSSVVNGQTKICEYWISQTSVQVSTLEYLEYKRLYVLLLRIYGFFLKLEKGDALFILHVTVRE